MTKRSRSGTKGERRATQRTRQIERSSTLPGDGLEHAKPRTQRSRKPLQPLTSKQAAYLSEIEAKDLIFCKGPAGTGKTFVAAAKAAEMMEAKIIEKIIVTRPAVGAEEEYGFFPGELEEKVAPWAKPVISILEQRMGAGAVEYLLKAGKIEVAPLGMLRGTTFENAFVIFDEAQNATPSQMKLFLTRIGENVKMIVDGDPDEQNDLRDPRGRPLLSGFTDAWDRMQGHHQIGFITFDVDDIVRSGLCRDILLRYRKESAVGHAELHTFISQSATS